MRAPPGKFLTMVPASLPLPVMSYDDQRRDPSSVNPSRRSPILSLPPPPPPPRPSLALLASPSGHSPSDSSRIRRFSSTRSKSIASQSMDIPFASISARRLRTQSTGTAMTAAPPMIPANAMATTGSNQSSVAPSQAGQYAPAHKTHDSVSQITRARVKSSNKLTRSVPSSLDVRRVRQRRARLPHRRQHRVRGRGGRRVHVAGTEPAGGDDD